MATKNPWTEVDVEDLIDLGTHAIKTGYITPDVAAKNYSAIHPVLQHLGVGQDPVLYPKYSVQKQNRDAIAKIRKEVEAEQTGTVNVPTRNPAVYDKLQVEQDPLEMPYVSPVAKGSGLSNSSRVSQGLNMTDMDESLMQEADKDRMQKDAMNKLSSQLVQYEPLAEWTQRVQGLKESPVFEDQRRGIQNMQELAALEAQAPVDIYSGPIAGLLQTEFGRNVGAMTANKGMSPTDHRNRLLGYNEKIQDDVRDLNSKILEAAKGQKIGTTTDIVSNRLLQEQSQEALRRLIERDTTLKKQEREKIAKAYDPLSFDHQRGPTPQALRPRLFDAFQKSTKDDRDALNYAQNALKTLTSGSKVGMEAFKNFMARASGEKGPLTKEDVARFSGDPSVVAKLERVFTKYSDGVLTPEDEADMKLLAQKYVEFRRDILKKSSDYFVNQVAPGAYMTDPKTAQKLLVPFGGFGLKEEQYDPVKKPEAKKDEMISVISPDGKKGKMSKAKFDEAVKKGAKFRRAD